MHEWLNTGHQKTTRALHAGRQLLFVLGVAVNDQKDVRTCKFGRKFFSRNDFFLGKL
jgi:hypothetical protein